MIHCPEGNFPAVAIGPHEDPLPWSTATGPSSSRGSTTCRVVVHPHQVHPGMEGRPIPGRGEHHAARGARGKGEEQAGRSRRRS